MIDSLKRASAEPVPCKICGDPAPLYGVVDFNRNCEIPNGVKVRTRILQKPWRSH
jgi:hypothetical protein